MLASQESTIESATVPPGPTPQGGTEGDRALLDAARSGDDGAFARLIERHDPLLGVLAAGLLDGEGTDRLLTESYVRAYRALGRQQADPLAWLVRTTYLTCLAEARRRERRRIGGPGRLPDRRPDAADPTLAGLAADERAVLILTERCGLELAMVAEALEASEATTSALLERARATLAGRSPQGDGEVPDAPHAPVQPPPGPAAPAHGEHFWSELGERLLAERAAPAVPLPSLPAAGVLSEVDRGHRAPPVAMQRRAPRAARERRREPDPVDGLAVRARSRRVRPGLRRTLMRLGLVLVVLAVLAAGVTAVVRIGSRAKSPVRSNSVSELAQRTVSALDVEVFTAAYTRTTVAADGAEQEVTYQLVRKADGSYLLFNAGRVVLYDATTNRRRTQVTTTGATGATTVSGTDETGLAAGPPDPASGDADLPDAELDLALRALATVTDESATAIEVDGEDAWRLESALPSGSQVGADRVTLVVDAARLAPLSVEYRAGDSMVRRLTFGQVTLDTPDPGPLTAQLSGEGVTPVDRGFRAVQVGEVVDLVGYEPLRPTFLPTGFELDATTVRAEGKVVSLRYRRGFQQVVVTTRTSPVTAGEAWRNPFPNASVAPSSEVAIEGGRFRGTTAQQSTSLGYTPSLWGSDGQLAYTVWGDLTDDELVRVVESLRA